MQSKVGEFEIVRELARGGVGIVYLAHDTHLGRNVALKVLKRAPNLRALQRFQTEARSLARLVHPHIVRVHAAREHEGHPYFVMDYIHGESLQDRLRMGPLAPRDAAELLHKLARAVDYAHRQGILHRDIKPANVIVDLEGEPRLADFGLAKAADLTASTPVSVSGRPLGTLGFCSPEQATGQPDIGPQTDVYGLGATLFAALTMRAPIEWESELEALSATCQRDVPPPSSLQRSVPAALDAICLRCLAKSPDDRYASAGELADALKAFVVPSEATARRAAPWPLIVVAAAVTVIGLVGVAYHLGQSQRSALAVSLAPRSSARPLPVAQPSGTRSPTTNASPSPAGGVLTLEKRIEAATAREDLATVRRLIDEALAKDPGDLVALAAETDLLLLNQDYEGALALSARVLLRDPSKHQLHFTRGYSLVELKRYPEAIEEYTFCVERGLSLKDSLFNRAIASRLAGRPREAVLDCDRLVKEGFASARVHHVRGDAYTDLGLPSDAAKAYAAALRFDPNMAGVWFRLGLARVNSNDNSGALDAYQKTLDLDPKHPWANFNMGMIRGAAGDFKSAIEDFERALEVTPPGKREGVMRCLASARAGDRSAFLVEDE